MNAPLRLLDEPGAFAAAVTARTAYSRPPRGPFCIGSDTRADFPGCPNSLFGIHEGTVTVRSGAARAKRRAGLRFYVGKFWNDGASTGASTPSAASVTTSSSVIGTVVPP